jgi:hypothetical protein
MFKNRFLALMSVVPLFVVAVLLVQQPNATTIVAGNIDSATRSYIAQAKAAESQNVAPAKDVGCEANLGPNAGLDSATRSYIAWAKAVEAESYAVDSATQSYIAQAKAIEAERYAIDSATRSYIAWGKAVEAQRLAC